MHVMRYRPYTTFGKLPKRPATTDSAIDHSIGHAELERVPEYTSNSLQNPAAKYHTTHLHMLINVQLNRAQMHDSSKFQTLVKCDCRRFFLADRLCWQYLHILI